MTKNEFLDKLREALGNDLAATAAQENTQYYSQYILGEMGKGRSEEEVVEELGDPWVIARTIIDTTEGAQSAGAGYAYESDGQTYGQQGNYVRRTGFFRNGGWRLIVALLGLVGILLAIVAVVGGIISLVAPILVPVLIIAFVVRLFGRRQ